MACQWNLLKRAKSDKPKPNTSLTIVVLNSVPASPNTKLRRLSLAEKVSRRPSSVNESPPVRPPSPSTYGPLNENYTFHGVPFAEGSFSKVYLLKNQYPEGKEDRFLILRVSKISSAVWTTRMEVEALQRIGKRPHKKLIEQPDLGPIETIWWSKNDATISVILVASFTFLFFRFPLTIMQNYYPSDLYKLWELVLPRDDEYKAVVLKKVIYDVVRFGMCFVVLSYLLDVSQGVLTIFMDWASYIKTLNQRTSWWGTTADVNYVILGVPSSFQSARSRTAVSCLLTSVQSHPDIALQNSLCLLSRPARRLIPSFPST